MKRCILFVVGVAGMVIGVFLFVLPFHEEAPWIIAGRSYHLPALGIALIWGLRLLFCIGGLVSTVAAFRSRRHVEKAFSDLLNSL